MEEIATMILAQFFAQAQTRPPENPVHDLDALERLWLAAMNEHKQ